jgi:Mrp family chromosome partitioning ATPase
VGVDPERTRVLADTFAEELGLYLADFDVDARQQEIATYERQAAPLRDRIATLEATRPLVVDPVEGATLDAELATTRAQLLQLEQEVERLRADEGPAPVLQSVSPAEAVAISGPEFRDRFQSVGASDEDLADPERAVSGSRELGAVARLGLGALVGLALGVAAAFLLERFDPRLRTKADTESVFGWPVLAEIPTLSRAEQAARTVLAREAPLSRGAEAYRGVRSSVLFALRSTGSPELVPVLPADRHRGAAPDAGDDEGPAPSGRVVLVTSPGPGEGKTTTASNLATVLGEAGHRVLVMNCDFRRPTLDRYLGATDPSARVVATEVPNVHLLARVTDEAEANPAEVIATQRAAIEEARRRFDVVVLDTAPLLTTNDANEILDATDLVVVVARAGRTTTEAADRCAEQLDRRKAPVLGVVLVAATDAPMGRHYYYGDYYLGDGTGHAPRSSVTGPPPAAAAPAPPPADPPAGGAPDPAAEPPRHDPTAPGPAATTDPEDEPDPVTSPAGAGDPGTPPED